MRSLAAALALTLLAATASAYDKKALEEHIRESYQLPSEVSLAFGEAKGSDVPGFDAIPLTLTFNGRSQNETLFLSKNDRHYILGGFKDLKVLPSQERIKKMDLRTAPMRGKADAPVSVVQYTDFQCPFCERGYTIMRDKILKEFEGKVKWYYKALPLGFHDWAEPAAVAVECVKTQGVDKFWTMHDELFDKQGDITAADFDAKAAEFAKKAGADAKAFDECYKGKKTLEAVRRDADEAAGMGISGTPAFVVNGQLVSGADEKQIRRIVEDQLKKVKRGGEKP
ncbi:MAG TPA: hypothetical protein DCM05_03025 [Elusimicrobia bacterium]|nr:hypothetical protein [Elusimicrobiota bacterium]